MVNKSKTIIIGVIAFVFMVIGAILMATGTSNDNGTMMGIGIAILVLSFGVGMLTVAFRTLKSVSYCQKCGSRKVSMMTKKGDSQYFEYKCPKCD